MRVLKRAARFALHASGALRPIRWSNRARLRILMYHRFRASARPELEWQCAYLRKHYQVISLAEAGRMIAGGGELPHNAVAVTVDDGYDDVFSVAFPVFRAFGIPATVFLTTGFLDGAVWLWPDRVRYTVARTQVARIELPLSSGLLKFSFGNDTPREEIAMGIAVPLTFLPQRERLRWIEDLPRLLNVDLPATPPAEYAPVTWRQVRAMTREGLEFGAHSITHPILSRLSGPELLAEVEGSKRRVEEELDRPAPHFCYPNGLAGDFNAEVVAAVRGAGCELAVTAEPGLNVPGGDLFALRRLAAAPGMSRYVWKEQLAGFRV